MKGNKSNNKTKNNKLIKTKCLRTKHDYLPENTETCDALVKPRPLRILWPFLAFISFLSAVVRPCFSAETPKISDNTRLIMNNLTVCLIQGCFLLLFLSNAEKYFWSTSHWRKPAVRASLFWEDFFLCGKHIQSFRATSRIYMYFWFKSLFVIIILILIVNREIHHGTERLFLPQNSKRRRRNDSYVNANLYLRCFVERRSSDGSVLSNTEVN